MEDLGSVLDADNRSYTAMSRAITECLDAVDRGHVDDAAPWLVLAELLTPQGADRVWNSAVLGPVACALDYYCFAAAHDHDVVYDGLRKAEVRRLLVDSAEILAAGSSDLPEGLEVFRETAMG